MDTKIIIQNLTIKNMSIQGKAPYTDQTHEYNNDSSSIPDLQKFLKKVSESTRHSLMNDLRRFE